MPEIKVIVKNKVARATNHAPIVCGNSDYTVRFDFDEEWTAHPTRTARIISSTNRYEDGRYQTIMGYESETVGYRGNYSLAYFTKRNATEEITGRFDFRTTPQMSATLSADDSSTAIPNTAWVNAAIEAALTARGL